MANDAKVQQLSFEPGQRLVCSSGEYSSYQVYGCYKVLKKFGTHTFEEFCAAQTGGYDSPRGFLEFLVREKYVRKMPTQELFLGDYGDKVFMLTN